MNCSCSSYWNRDHKTIYVRVQTQSQVAYGAGPRGQKRKAAWKPVGVICLKCKTVGLTAAPAPEPELELEQQAPISDYRKDPEPPAP